MPMKAIAITDNFKVVIGFTNVRLNYSQYSLTFFGEKCAIISDSDTHNYLLYNWVASLQSLNIIDGTFLHLCDTEYYYQASYLFLFVFDVLYNFITFIMSL